MKSDSFVKYFLIVIALVLVPFLCPNDYWMNIIILSGVYAILAQGLNLMVGVTGQFVICHAAFYGIGAYFSALCALRLGLPFWLNMPLAGVIASFFGAGIGYMCNRFRGHYVAIVTFSFGVIVYEVILNWLSLTRGPMGLISISPPERINFGLFSLDFTSKTDFYILIVVMCILCIASVKRLINSRVGLAMLAIREDDVAAEILGVNIEKYKVKAFIVGAWWAGIAGSFYAHYAGIIVPNTLSFLTSVEVLVIVVVGGLGSIYGVLFSAIILTFLPEFLRAIEFLRWIIYGIVLMVMIIFMPTGLAGAAKYIKIQFLRSRSTQEFPK